MTRISHWLGAVGVCALSGLATPAFAEGTTAGQTITNSVQVTYQVGGVSQNQITATDTFTVDRKVNVTVTRVGTTAVQVSPGQEKAVTAFTVLNLSNATLDFALTAAQQAGGAAAISGTDTFDTTNTKIYVDTDGSGGYNTTDAEVTFLDELGADVSRLVFIVSDVPLGQATDTIATVALTATGREGAGVGAQGAVLVQQANNTSGMETVFADGAGATDAARNADFSARHDYRVLAAALTVTKSSRVISDPINLTDRPKMIPGAVVEYCIAVANASGGAAAGNVSLTDVLPGATTYQSTFGVKLNGTVTGSTCNADGPQNGAHNAGTVTGTLGSVAAGNTRTMLFRVTVN